MSRPLSATAPRDPIRALFLCLVVLAQLLMPSALAQARAAQGDGCVALGSVPADDGKASKQTPQAHGQECAHCRPQVIVLSAPAQHPEIAVAPAFETVIARGETIGVAAPQKSLPPATGPPAASSRG